jgi:hypothetical protein
MSTQPVEAELSAPVPLASMPSQQSPVLAIPLAEHSAESTSNPAPVRQDAQAPITGVTAEVLTKVAVATSQKQGSQESSDNPKREPDSSDKTTLSWTPTAGTTSKFDNHLAAAEAPRSSTQVQEMPQMPTPISAHKVSIDIGDKESKVIVTLHERAGDVSVKVHAANDTLKAQLQSSVGSLVESLNRANVSLKNVDFSSGYGTTSQDTDQRNTPQYKHLAPRTKPSNTQPESATDDSVRLSSV